eukprot:m.363163 g.363163  ORF g.363163 m.363163 type:complete len:302 (-) comp21577_c0_seq1:202-1107(-)
MGLLEQAPPVLCYCLASMSMIYTNKFVLSVYEFRYASTLVVIQSAIAVLTLSLLGATQLIQLPRFRWATVVQWAPVTLFFGLMLYTGSKTLSLLTIPVMTVFKNMTNLFIAFGDWYLFGQIITLAIFVSFVVMVIGSVLTGFSDLNFNLEGYVWMAINCLAQASYVLYMRHAKQTTKLSDWGMAMYNNALCVVVVGIGAIVSGEVLEVPQYPQWGDPLFLTALGFSGLIGTGLSFCVFWCVSATSPTTYSMIGALNKVPVTVLSVLFFHVNMDWKTWVSICVGLSAGVLYTYAKQAMRNQT